MEKVMIALDKIIENERICEIERDIVLERLRKIYDGVLHLDLDNPQEKKPVATKNENADKQPIIQNPAIDREIIHSLYDSNEFSVDLASILASRTNNSLRSSLVLNDRLMLLNDLFDNDEALCDKTLDALDMADTIDDAYIYLYEHFTLDESKEGAKRLIALLESKFS